MPFIAALLLATITGASAPSRSVSISPPPAMQPKIGQVPPAFTLRDQNGRRVSLSEAAGKKVVLVFYRGYW